MDQVRRLVNRIKPKDFPIVVKALPDSVLDPYVACAVYSYDNESGDIEVGQLRISRKFLNEEEMFLKCIIFHEVGHYYDVWTDVRNVYQRRKKSHILRELDSQRWAIRIAKEKGYTRIARELHKEITERWANYGWNKHKGNYRKYILASRLYVTE